MRIFTHVPTQLEHLPKITNQNGDRVYQVGKLYYPSVTTVLSQHTRKGIQEWQERVGYEEAKKISSRAAANGTRFHTHVEQYLKNNQTLAMSLIEVERLSLFEPYLYKIDNIRAQEATLYSDHLRLAGTVDCIAEYDGKLSVVDFKTSAREKELAYVQHYFMQAAAYAIMFEERTGVPISNLVVLVSVADGLVQEFTSKRDKHVKDLLFYRDQYEAHNQ